MKTVDWQSDDDTINAPFSPATVEAIKAHQGNPKRHPLTCFEGCRKKPLSVDQGGLICEECGKRQFWVPRVCVEPWGDEG